MFLKNLAEKNSPKSEAEVQPFVCFGSGRATLAIWLQFEADGQQWRRFIKGGVKVGLKGYEKTLQHWHKMDVSMLMGCLAFQSTRNPVATNKVSYVIKYD